MGKFTQQSGMEQVQLTAHIAQLSSHTTPKQVVDGIDVIGIEANLITIASVTSVENALTTIALRRTDDNNLSIDAVCSTTIDNVLKS